MLLLRNYAFLVCFALLAFSGNIQASTQPVGHVIVVSGPVSARATDGQTRILERRSPIYAGDVITTGKYSLQIRFNDGGLTSLRQGTEFKVEAFSWAGQEDGSEKGFFSLLKGGLRTLTGSIGKKNNDQYQMTTPVATIGIRGTFYQLRLCDGDCGDGTQKGLFGGVNEGEINVANTAGNRNFAEGIFFLVTDLDEMPEELLEPPEFLFEPEFDRPEEPGDRDEDGPKEPDNKGEDGPKEPDNKDNDGPKEPDNKDNDGPDDDRGEQHKDEPDDVDEPDDDKPQNSKDPDWDGPDNPEGNHEGPEDNKNDWDDEPETKGIQQEQDDDYPDGPGHGPENDFDDHEDGFGGPGSGPDHEGHGDGLEHGDHLDGPRHGGDRREGPGGNGPGGNGANGNDNPPGGGPGPQASTR